MIMINYAPEPVAMPLTMQPPWKIGKLWYGHPLQRTGASWTSRLQANDAVVFEVRR